jgi:hypothetical protein
MEVMNKSDINISLLKLLFLTTILIFDVCISYSQPNLPQRSMTVSATQAIHFGSFFCISNLQGTVTVGYDGSRTSTGGVTLLSMAPTSQPAIFDIKLCPGRNVIITYDAKTELIGSNGGPTLTLEIGPTEKGISGSSFTTNSDCNFITQMRMGGKLNIPYNATPGTFTGSFDIIFNQE